MRGAGGAFPDNSRLLGVLLAGGRSRRFGGEKAISELGGRPMAAWTLEAIRPWTSEQLVITGSDGVGERLDLAARPDLEPGLGPLGGLATGLASARDLGMAGILLVACDLPLLTPELIGKILRAWPPDAHAVVPGSHGPLGFEPLCAAYATECLSPVQELLQGGARAMDLALSHLGAYVIPPEELGTEEELKRSFMNVNTRADHEWAESELLSSPGRAGTRTEETGP